MDSVVEKLRASGSVHGYPRFPNIIVCGDKLYWVDLAWPTGEATQARKGGRDTT